MLQHCQPLRCRLSFTRASWVIQPRNVRLPHDALKLRRKAVRRHMHHTPARCNARTHRRLHRIAIRPVVQRNDLAARACGQPARQLRIQLPVAQGAVQVDQQTACGRRKKRHRQRLRRLLGQRQGTRVPAAMRLQQRLVACKQGSVGRRHLAPTMLAGDDECVSHNLPVTNCPSQRVSVAVNLVRGHLKFS